jgi:hypothetical protein
MIEHFALELCSMYEQLTVNIQSLAGSLTPTADLHPEYKRSMARTGLQRVLDQHKRLDFGASVILRAGMLHQLLMDGHERYTAELLAKDLHAIMMEIILVLRDRKFAYIPPVNAPYFEQEKLFGEQVYETFESARQDIKDAGNCFAASLYTACIFHLMRASEHGLRRLAKKLRVTLTHTKKLIPLEYGEWDKIITGINGKISAARALPSGPKRQRTLELFSDAGQHCLFMKDIWRNTASHARKAYTPNEALAAMERIRDFMQFLAKGMK